MLNAIFYKRKSEEDKKKQIPSLKSQDRSVRDMSNFNDYHIIDCPDGIDGKANFEEEKTARVPGRPKFNKMQELLYAGRAEYILCWDINRLSRNPIDGGNLVWLVQTKDVKIVTPTKTYGIDDFFELNFQLVIAHKYSLDLAKASKRGVNDKLLVGKAPLRAPIGYFNDVSKLQGLRDILPDDFDPTWRFTLVRQMWDLLLTGKYTPPKILQIATDEWGLRQRNGQPLSRSKVYEMFANVFYDGKHYIYGQVLYDNGVHKPMITPEEFKKAQVILHKNAKVGLTLRDSPYNGGVAQCVCGSSIGVHEMHRKVCPNCHKKYNAEQNTKCPRCGAPAPENTWECTYLGCNRKRDANCKQPAIDLVSFNKQLDQLLATLTIPQEFIDWTLRKLRKSNDEEVSARTAIHDSLQAVVGNATRMLDNLERQNLSDANRTGDIWSPKDFSERKKKLQQERDNAIEQLQGLAVKQDQWMETAEVALNFARHAREKFDKGTNDEKRTIFLALGVNPTLDNKILRIDLLKVLEKTQEAQKRLRDEKLTCEPDNRLAVTPQTLEDKLQNPVWGD